MEIGEPASATSRTRTETRTKTAPTELNMFFGWLPYLGGKIYKINLEVADKIGSGEVETACAV